MAYDLEDIIRFSNDVMRNNPPSRNIKASKFNHWINCHEQLQKCQRNYSSNPQNQSSIYTYALALADAARYLISKKPPPLADRMHFLATHVEFLHSNYQNGSLKLPLQKAYPAIQRNPEANNNPLALRGLSLIVNAAEFAVNTAIPKSPEAIQFLESSEFKAFEQYRDFLLTDSRDHSFWGTDLDLHKPKHFIMTSLIMQLKLQTSIQGIQTVLKSFKEQKGTLDVNEDGSIKKYSGYDILNTGQNITTRILGLLGLKNTTSIQRFENLIQKAEESETTHTNGIKVR